MCENQPLVSIIMPVYNCEKYLQESIESVLSQSYQNWELLIVDDGSRDRSLSIIESYVEKDSRVQLFQNDSNVHGPGIARNYGIEQIHGKYTYFIDADDWIEKDLLHDTVTLAEQTGADIVPFGYIIEDDGKQIRKPLKPCGNFEYQDFKNIANDITRGTWSECHEIIRSSLLENVRHNAYRSGEDICFQMDLLCHVRKVCGINKVYYHYRVVSDSITHTYKWDDVFQEIALAIWDKEKKFLEYCGLTEDSQTMKGTAIERYTGTLYQLCERKCPLSLREKYTQVKYIAGMMEIDKFKKQYDCSGYSGVQKILKLLVKYNLEMAILLVGTAYSRFMKMFRDK